MSEERQEITELDILAYADGFLESDPERRAQVERYLEDNADVAAYVAEIQAQNEEIRDHYGPLLSKPVPETLHGLLYSDRRGESRRRLAAAAGVFVLLAASAAGGWLIGHQSSGQETAMKEFVEQAAASHEAALSKSAASQGAEVRGTTQPLAWLTERISLELRAPNLSASGFELVAKKQLGPDHDPTVQLLYSRADGAKMNLFLRPRWEGNGGKLHKADVGERTVLYWLDGPLAFAMTFDEPGTATDTLVQTVQGALDRARLNESAPATALSPASPSPATEQTLDNSIPGLSRPAIPGTEQDGTNLQVN